MSWVNMYCETTAYLLLMLCSIAVFALINAIDFIDCKMPNEIMVGVYTQLLLFVGTFLTSCVCINCCLRIIRLGFIIPLAGIVVTLIFDYFLYNHRDYTCDSTEVNYKQSLNTVYYTQGAIFTITLGLFLNECSCGVSVKSPSYNSLED